jgi:hypothetical protein
MAKLKQPKFSSAEAKRLCISAQISDDLARDTKARAALEHIPLYQYIERALLHWREHVRREGRAA